MLVSASIYSEHMCTFVGMWFVRYNTYSFFILIQKCIEIYNNNKLKRSVVQNNDGSKIFHRIVYTL